MLKQLKRAGIDDVSLIQFYCACIRIRSVLEYASQAFHVCLPNYLSDQIERVQKRALRIVYPELSYREALAEANLMSLFDRREYLCTTLFNQIIESDGQHKLAGLLPVPNNMHPLQSKEQANVLITKDQDEKISDLLHYAFRK